MKHCRKRSVGGYIILLVGLLALLFACRGVAKEQQTEAPEPQPQVVVGAADTAAYFPLIREKRVALLANHTARVGECHLVDLLVERGIRPVVIFSPEHGFRGEADAGAGVAGGVDAKTGIPIRSLYNGTTRRPSNEAMRSFDILLVDMQDVGVRFYTYYIAMLRMMEAAADCDREVIILDRPNPHGGEVDGPILDMERYKSGIGALPIPVLHGLTLGEMALMAVGEGWIPPCRLRVIPCLHYTHSTPWSLRVAPSPNLKRDRAVGHYPSLCLFEGTVLSMGRGTEHPFECFGHPALKGVEGFDFAFTPIDRPGANNPLYEGKVCYGVDLRNREPLRGLHLDYVVQAYHALGLGEAFFNPFFEKLIGTDRVRRMILEGRTAAEIEASWQSEVEVFKRLRADYLLYEE